MYKNILKYWNNMEYFTPCYPNKANSNHNKLPWESKKTDFQDNIYFDIYVGKAKTCDMANWMIDTLDHPKYKKIEVNDSSFCCLFALKTDSKGSYIDNSFEISSFMWAICRLVKYGYDSDLTLNDFKEIRNKIIDNYLTNSLHVNDKLLKNIYDEIYKSIDLPKSICNFDFFSNKIKEENNHNSINPSTELISSFYLEDIEKIQQFPTSKIIEFICGNNDKKIEIDSDIEQMKEWTNPTKYPLGMWPSTYSPCLMQQIAINLAISDNQDIFSVNGPPGTGKTTLLKEIIASNIIERANTMLNYVTPDEAFQQAKFNSPPDIYNTSYYKIDANLSKYNIIVASNNNAAVENISLDLPKEINKSRTGKFSNITNEGENYFSNIATQLIDKSAWGLISAKLGKKSNINDFVNTIWYGKEKNNNNNTLKYYIKEAKQFKSTGKCNINIPNWETAKKNYKNAQKEVYSLRENCIEAFNVVKAIEELKQKLIKKNQDFKSISEKLNSITTKIDNLLEEKQNLQNILNKQMEILEQINKEIPFIIKVFKSFFKSHGLVQQLNKLESEISDCKTNIKNIDDLIVSKQTNSYQLKNQLTQIAEEIEGIKSSIKKYDQQKAKFKDTFGNSFADSDFWKNITGNGESQSLSPYTYDSYNKARENLFFQALMLHKAFILNSNAVCQNVNRLINMWNGNFNEDDKDLAYADLLNTLQLIVPVISTTFASVQSFLGNIRNDELGLLIIDEAGQATPQSALGAIWRCKKTIIVGDPLQIEPIFTIPKVLQETLSDKYSIDSKYKDANLSVQILGDDANRYGGKRTINGKDIFIGCPLILHRRCVDPMFTISNEVAYDNKMINKTHYPNELKFILKESAWIDVKGNVVGKGNQNVKKQNDIALKLFEKAFSTTNQLPDIYIVSPFKKVTFELKKLLFQLINNPKTSLNESDIKNWIDIHCGTIHTFQGKEANEVILVMGCDPNIGANSAKWVGQKPNIINVAVSRAKYRIYIIGDYEQWKQIPNINIACNYLRHIESDKLNDSFDRK